MCVSSTATLAHAGPNRAGSASAATRRAWSLAFAFAFGALGERSASTAVVRAVRHGRVRAGRSAGFKFAPHLTRTWYVWRRNGSLIGINVAGAHTVRSDWKLGSDSISARDAAPSGSGRHCGMLESDPNFQPRFASRLISGHLRPWHAGLAQKFPPSVPHLSGPWHIAHDGSIFGPVIVHPVGRAVAVRRRQARTRPWTRPSSSFPAMLTCGMSWHSVHWSLIASPFSLKCLPSWQRKQPGESLCPTWFGNDFHVRSFAFELRQLEDSQHRLRELRLGGLLLGLLLTLGRRVADDRLELRDLLLHRAMQARSFLDDRHCPRLDRRDAGVDQPFRHGLVDAVRRVRERMPGRVMAIRALHLPLGLLVHLGTGHLARRVEVHASTCRPCR